MATADRNRGDLEASAGPGDDLGQLARRQRELLDRLAADQQHLRGLARSVWRVQEDERRRLARELHDGIGQNLTALKHALALLGSEAPAALRPRIEQALALCSGTLEETRRLSRLLRPQVLDDLGLRAALGWLARTLAPSGGPEVELRWELDAEPDGETATVLFRIAQEGLANAIRHARAGQVLLQLGRDEGFVEMLVRDDGAGCVPDAAWARGSRGESGGLPGMRERARLLGGELAFESEPGRGSALRCRLPLDPLAGTGDEA